MSSSRFLNIKAAHTWHRWLIGSGVGERTRAFLKGLRWTIPAAVMSRFFAGVATMFTARYLGPSEFGQASLVLATTLWVQVPLFLGLPAALMRFIPVSEPKEREAWVGTSLSLLALSGGATLAAGVIWSGFWASLLGVTRNEFQIGLLWCFAFLFYTTATYLAAARERFRMRATLEVLFALLFLLQIGGLWLYKNLHADLYIKAMALSYGLVGLVGLLGQSIGGVVADGFGRRVRSLIVFGLIASTGSIAGALLQSVSRLMANQYLDISQVGLLSAYQSGSLQMALYFLGFGLHVFLPIAARTPDRPSLFAKLTRLSAVTVAGTGLFCGAILVAYFLFLGRRYPLGLKELVVFTLASGLATQHGILSWFFTSGGTRGMVAAVVVSLVAGVLNAVFCWFWIPHWGVFGAGSAAAVAYWAGILACYIPMIKRYGLT